MRWTAVLFCALAVATISPQAFAAHVLNLQKNSWGQYILTSSTQWQMCTSCTSPTYLASYQTGIASPSLSGSAARFNIGGSQPYTDVLWNQHLFRYETLNGSDIVETSHHFIYDVYFYVKNLSAMQAIEFDINQYFNGQRWTWGHECRSNPAGNEWDVWSPSVHWVATGIPCHPKANAWNHVQIQVERTSTGETHYVSISLNGTTAYVNKVFPKMGVDSTWHAITINFQLDGDSQMDDYSVWLDNLGFYYW